MFAAALMTLRLYPSRRNDRTFRPCNLACFLVIRTLETTAEDYLKRGGSQNEHDEFYHSQGIGGASWMAHGVSATGTNL